VITAVRAIVVSALLAASQTQSSPVAGFGSVKGTVLDERGVGIPDAEVYDEPMDSVRIGKDHFASTDAEGKFFLTDVPAGKTMVIATKTKAGYPDARYALYTSNEVLPVVEVHPGQVTSEVVVKLAGKGGLMRGQIVDTQTKRPVSQAVITLWRVDHPAWSLETAPDNDGTFEFLIPTRAMHFRVRAQGYKTWEFEALSKNHEPLTVVPEGTRNVDVNLERNGPN
jgi:hypothetical protein